MREKIEDNLLVLFLVVSVYLLCSSSSFFSSAFQIAFLALCHSRPNFFFLLLSSFFCQFLSSSTHAFVFLSLVTSSGDTEASVKYCLDSSCGMFGHSSTALVMHGSTSAQRPLNDATKPLMKYPTALKKSEREVKVVVRQEWIMLRKCSKRWFENNGSKIEKTECMCLSSVGNNKKMAFIFFARKAVKVHLLRNWRNGSDNSSSSPCSLTLKRFPGLLPSLRFLNIAEQLFVAKRLQTTTAQHVVDRPRTSNSSRDLKVNMKTAILQSTSFF